MNKEIKQIEISRSYDRKIKFGDTYEMLGLFSSWKAIIDENTPEEEIKEISNWLYQQAQEEVDLKVDILKDPQKVLRGYASIAELRKAVKSLTKKVEELEAENSNLKPKDEPF